MSGVSLFDRVVMVDWSANATPKRGRDSIWIADSESSAVVNPSTRSEAMDAIDEVIETSISQRVLIGFDFSFGYPAGFAEAVVGEPGAGWRSVWAWCAENIADDDRNRNDRLEVAAALNDRLAAQGHGTPFWGYPGAERHDGLSRSRPDTYAPFDEFRITEHRVRIRGHRPFSSWQLAYPGSVGSQMLLGIRSLELLRRRHGERVRIWPFETADAPVTIAEIWPSMFDIDVSLHPVRDAAQVMTMVQRLAAADADGTLADWFAPDLTVDEWVVVSAEEGWTFGVR